MAEMDAAFITKMIRDELERRDSGGYLGGGDGGDGMSTLEQRVGVLETDMRDVKATLGRLEPMIIRIDEQLRSTLPHLATKAEVADLRTEVRAGLAEKPGKTYMWGVVGVMTAAVFGAVVLGATLT